jgi:hypothetical protein
MGERIESEENNSFCEKLGLILCDSDNPVDNQKLRELPVEADIPSYSQARD